jgi:hypothetical protein
MKKPDVVYETRLINKSGKDWSVLERGGYEMLRLPPNDETVLISYRPDKNFLSRFSLIRRNGDGTVDVKLNKSWPRPEAWQGKWMITLLNENPNCEHEVVSVNGVAQHLYFGIPVETNVDIDDPLVWYKSLTKKQISEKVRDKEHPNYLVTETKTISDKKPRSDEDLKKIVAELEKAQATRGMKAVLVPNDIKAKL